MAAPPASRRGDEDRFRIHRHDFQDLSEDARIRALEALRRDDLDAGVLRELGHHSDPAFAIGIAETDETDGFEATLFHMRDDDGGHLRVALRCFEHPGAFRIHWIDDRRRTGEADHRRLLFGDIFKQRERIRRQARTEDDVDLVFGHEFLGVFDRGAGIRRVVEQDIFGLLAAELRRQDADRTLLRDAHGGGRACRRNDDSHFHLRNGRGGQRRRRDQGVE